MEVYRVAAVGFEEPLLQSQGHCSRMASLSYLWQLVRHIWRSLIGRLREHRCVDIQVKWQTEGLPRVNHLLECS